MNSLGIQHSLGREDVWSSTTAVDVDTQSAPTRSECSDHPHDPRQRGSLRLDKTLPPESTYSSKARCMRSFPRPCCGTRVVFYRDIGRPPGGMKSTCNATCCLKRPLPDHVSMDHEQRRTQARGARAKRDDERQAARSMYQYQHQALLSQGGGTRELPKDSVTPGETSTGCKKLYSIAKNKTNFMPRKF